MCAVQCAMVFLLRRFQSNITHMSRSFAVVLPGHGHALDAGRLHGQGAEVHRQSTHADRQAKK